MGIETEDGSGSETVQFFFLNGFPPRDDPWGVKGQRLKIVVDQDKFLRPLPGLG